MTRLSLEVVALIAFTGLMPGASVVPNKAVPPKNKQAPVRTAKKTARKSAWRPAAAKSTHPTKTVRTAAVTRPYTPQQPSQERYQQIQQALVEKGYYKGEPNGQWNADSVDALRRFQADQNLATDGKLGSLSLIALGLGPKRTQAAAAPVKAPPDPITVDPGARQ